MGGWEYEGAGKDAKDSNMIIRLECLSNEDRPQCLGLGGGKDDGGGEGKKVIKTYIIMHNVESE